MTKPQVHAQPRGRNITLGPPSTITNKTWAIGRWRHPEECTVLTEAGCNCDKKTE